jgi:hypothetical protein
MFRQFTTIAGQSIHRFKIRWTAIRVYSPHSSHLVPKSSIPLIVNENRSDGLYWPKYGHSPRLTHFVLYLLRFFLPNFIYQDFNEPYLCMYRGFAELALFIECFFIKILRNHIYLSRFYSTKFAYWVSSLIIIILLNFIYFILFQSPA